MQTLTMQKQQRKSGGGRGRVQESVSGRCITEFVRPRKLILGDRKRR